MNNVCIVNNLYCLLLYMLIKKKEAFDDTLFFFDDDIPKSIVNQFPDSVKFLFVLKLRFYKYKYRCLKTAAIYGQDNLLITSPLIGKRKISILEDGMMNYTYQPVKIPYAVIRRMVGGPLFAQNPLGYSDSVDKEYLTGLSTIPDGIREKVQILNLQSMWAECTSYIKQRIISVFGINGDILDRFRVVDSILLTQPLSEDGAISEKEKIELYKDLIKDSVVAIKPHPREKTDYKRFFPKAVILPSALPFELLSLNGIIFKEVKTLFSTAALSVPGNPKISFAGTNVHPSLVKRWGNVSYKDGVLVRENG